MHNEIIYTNEHCEDHSLSEQELVLLIKEKNKLIESVDLNEKSFKTGYFIGLSWIAEKQKVIYIAPKLDSEFQKIDFLKMLSMCFKHPEVLLLEDDLFKIQFDQPYIKIKQQKDLITPLLIVYFLQLVKTIVKKGLKLGYYKVEKNLYTTIKGKVLVADTLKKNTFKNKLLNTICSYDEFGINNPENKIIKKALLFILRYLKINKSSTEDLSSTLNYILPAFSNVDDNISIKDIYKARKNMFYLEYLKGVDISIMILKRFSFNINCINKNEEIEVPPFWIDMPKVYEMYVLGKLKDSFGRNEIIFQSKANFGKLDFLRITKGYEMVIDAKYKPQYKVISYYDIDDIRQLSGYARDKKTLQKLSIVKENWKETVLNCLIIYPDQDASPEINPNELLKTSINQFERFHKVGISIPVIQQ